MTLFDAVYGDAYAAAEAMLARTALTAGQLRAILGKYLTSDGAMEAEQKLRDGSWPLFQRDEQGLWNSALPPLHSRPLTTLELRWLRSLCEDARAPLFLTDAQLHHLRNALADVPPVFAAGEIESFDASRSGDDFADPAYRRRFHTILRALREGQRLWIRYVSFAGRRRTLRLQPEKLEYSAKDRRYRLHGQCGGRPTTLNLARIEAIHMDGPSTEAPPVAPNLCAEPLVIRILNERNALERFMLEFSCFRKETSFDPETGTAVAKLWYPPGDETEVLIRVLGFGPSIQVTSPEAFLRRIRERIAMQPET